MIMSLRAPVSGHSAESPHPMTYNIPLGHRRSLPHRARTPLVPNSSSASGSERQCVPNPPGGKPVHLKNRDPRLPQLFEFDSHPLLEHVKDHVNKVYIYVQDTDPAARAAFYKYISPKSYKIPEGTRRGIEKAGKSLLMNINSNVLMPHRLCCSPARRLRLCP